MSVLALTICLLIASTLVGVLGALTGLGGGVLLVPMLVLLFHVNVHYAVGASLISVMATSSGASAAYIREGYTNLRIATLLQVPTVGGALLGALLAGHLRGRVIAIIFGVVLIASASLSLRRRREFQDEGRHSSPLAVRLAMEGSFPILGGWESYRVYNVMGGFGLMLVAGTISGLLGIGSGAVGVLAMDQVMRLPYKVSTTTNNFMIGVTAAASAGVYITRGFIDPGLTMPVMLGVILGAVVGARFLMVAKTELLRIIFTTIVILLALQMIHSALTGRI
jgi:uncharacterized membrane protein YfcA